MGKSITDVFNQNNVSGKRYESLHDVQAALLGCTEGLVEWLSDYNATFVNGFSDHFSVALKDKDFQEICKDIFGKEENDVVV